MLPLSLLGIAFKSSQRAALKKKNICPFVKSFLRWVFFLRNKSLYFTLFSDAPHEPAMVFLSHVCSRTPQRDVACWTEDRFPAYCATSVVQTNTQTNVQGQMESHRCPGSKRRASVCSFWSLPELGTSRAN